MYVCMYVCMYLYIKHIYIAYVCVCCTDIYLLVDSFACLSGWVGLMKTHSCEPLNTGAQNLLGCLWKRLPKP